MSRALFVATVATLLLGGIGVPAAAAQDDLYGGRTASSSRSAGARAPDPANPPETEVAVELGFGGMGEQVGRLRLSRFGVAPTLRARFRMGGRWELRGAWSFPYVSLSAEAGGEERSESRVTSGNPFVGGWYLLPMDRRLLRVGGGLAMPVARAGLDRLWGVLPYSTAGAALGTATAMHGAYEAWLWANQTLSIVLGADYRGEVGERWLATADAAVAVMVPSGDRAGDTELLLQWAAGISYAAGAAQLGLRALAAWQPNQEELQISLRPFLEYAMDEVFFRLALNLNLDEPYGFSFADGGYWGVLIAVGYRD